MPASPRKRDLPSTRHGATQPEADRLRAQVLLRLDAAARTALDALAARWGCTRSGAVERLALEAVAGK